MNTPKLIKNNLFIVLILSLCSCGWIIEDHRYDYLQEQEGKQINLLEGEEGNRPIVDYYPVPINEEKMSLSKSYEVPLPPQVFSSGSTNEIRMHKLGELRWIYVEALPSSVWPLMKDFWSLGDYGLSYENPNTGIIKSEEIPIGSSVTQLEMKIEHGIRQASSEIFLTHRTKDIDKNWVKVSTENNLEDKILRRALDFLSKTASSGGTSLVALNLNLGQKAILKQTAEGISFIEMDLEFPRAWAAVDRALKEAFIVVRDLNREKGVFFVTFSQKEEKGFVKNLFTRNQSQEEIEFKIHIKKVKEAKCIVTVDSEFKGNEVLERDLLSEINQSLS